MTPRALVLALLGLLGATFLSSLLGLSGRFLVTEPSHALGFMAGIWRASPLADAVFTIGTMLAFTLAFQLARRPGLVAVSIGVGLASHWLVYYASFLLLPGTIGEFEGADARRALWFVAAWGSPGLLFAMLAPPLAALWWERTTQDGPEPAPAG